MAQTIEMLATPPEGYKRGKETTPAELRYAIGWHNWIGTKYLRSGFNSHALPHFLQVDHLQKQLDSTLQHT
jgi:hypothetical protein